MKQNLTENSVASSPLVTLNHVGYRLPHKTILQDINFSLLPAEIMMIIGPNGAGKTTLLKLLLGLIAPTEGSLERLKTLQIGYMPQKIVINSLLPLTVEDFLKLSPLQPIDLQFLQQTLERLKIVSLKNQFLATLSGGEWQRVLLARALLRRPNLLVLDEPIQGVDVLGQAEFYQLLAQLRAELGCALLIVSHDLHWVMAASDKVVCLNRHICCSGHPQTIIKDPHYQHLFGPFSYPDSFKGIAPYIHQHDHRHDQGPL